RQAATRRIGLQRIAHGAVETTVVHRLRGKTGEYRHFASLGVVGLPEREAEHSQHERRDTPEKSPRAFLMPRRCDLREAHLLELRPLLAETRAFGLLAGAEQIALRLGDLRRGGLAPCHPSLRAVEIVTAQEERFGLAARLPARGQLAQSRVLT